MFINLIVFGLFSERVDSLLDVGVVHVLNVAKHRNDEALKSFILNFQLECHRKLNQQIFRVSTTGFWRMSGLILESTQ